MSNPTVRQLAVLDLAEKALKIGSGLCAIAVVALVATRSGLTEPPQLSTQVYVAVASEPQLTGSVSETESEASGYILVIETTPDGAEVTVNGESKGATPSSLNLDCAEGATLSVLLRHPGFIPLKRPMSCKRDTMVVMRATLEPAK